MWQRPFSSAHAGGGGRIIDKQQIDNLQIDNLQIDNRQIDNHNLQIDN